MVSTARAIRKAADASPFVEKARLTRSFELALQALSAAEPEDVKYQSYRKPGKSGEGLGIYSMSDLTPDGTGRKLRCEHNDAALPPKITVTTFCNGKFVQRLPLDNPEAAREFLDLFKDKVRTKDTLHSAKLTDIAANLPNTTIDSIRTLQRQGPQKAKLPGEIDQTYIGSLQDPAGSSVQLHVRTYSRANSDESVRPIVRISGKIGDIDLLATRHMKGDKNVDSVNITLGQDDRFGRLMTENAPDKVAKSVIETLLAKALILEPATPEKTVLAAPKTT